MAAARERRAAVVRVYAWCEPTLSLGRHQTARGRYDLAEAAARGVRFVRRPTGGRAVLHHRELTYAVAAPEQAWGPLAAAYARINRLVVGALRRLGVEASIAGGSGPAPRPGVAPCFEVPVAGEIVARGRKLVGSAQWRADGALLQHGSILVDDDQPLASALLLSPEPAPPSPATLRALLGRAPSVAELAGAFAAELGDASGGAPGTLVVDEALTRRAAELEERYRADEWTWRR